MSDLNRFVFSGKLGRDAELKYTSSGQALLNFPVANSESKKQADGSWDNVTTWIPCTVWREKAERLAPQLLKGTQVVVEGRMTSNEVVDKKSGDKRTYWSTTIDNVQIFKTNGNASSSNSGNQSSKGGNSFDEVEPDDIPF